jgi:hypothetical protein
VSAKQKKSAKKKSAKKKSANKAKAPSTKEKKREFAHFPPFAAPL